MSARFDCADPAQLLEGIAEAEAALRRGELVVLPTDTVYGIAAEAFDPVAVDGLLKAKGRGRDMPPPVLVGTVRAAMALVMDLADTGKDLIDAGYRPGPEFKAMLEAAEDAQLEGRAATTEDGLAVVRERFGAPSS